MSAEQLLDALTTPPPVDPDLDLVAVTVRMPRYAAEAVRMAAVIRRRKQQEIVLDALMGRQPLPQDLLTRCRDNAASQR